MKIQDVMTRNPETIHANDSILKAAKMMRDLNVGAVPVCEGDSPIGMITDRDITIRLVADKKDPDTRVKEVMSKDVVACPEDIDVGEAISMMRDRKIRRLLVKNNQDKIVGVVSIGDLAVKLGKDITGEAFREISSPAEPER